MLCSIGRLVSLQRVTIEFMFCLQPIAKLIAWMAAAVEIDFIGAESDLFTVWCVV
jgi:hypothetical protein